MRIGFDREREMHTLSAQVTNRAGEDAEDECAPGVNEPRGRGGSDESGDGTCKAPLGRLSLYSVAYHHSPEQKPTMLQLSIATVVSPTAN